VLAEYREENNVTLKWVGQQIGLTRAMVHHIESRKAMASLQTFRDLVKLMQLTPAEIGSLVLAQENIGKTIRGNRGTIWEDRVLTPRKARSNV